MGGLAILFVVCLYLAIGLWIVIKSPGWWRFVALLAVVLIPTADALWGRHVTLPQLCKDAGLKVYARASQDGGLLFEDAADDYYIVKYGFPFVEGQDAAGTYYRFSRIEGQEKALFENSVQPKARYIARIDRSGEGTHFRSNVYSMEDRNTAKVLAAARAHTYLGGWAEQFLAKFSDAGVSGVKGCGWETMSRENLIAAVFGRDV